MHLLRALRRGQQVEPELPAFGRDQGCIIRGEGGYRVTWLARADVVSFVNDDEAWLATRPVPPQCRQHGFRDKSLLVDGVERTQVNNKAARRRLLQFVDQ